MDGLPEDRVVRALGVLSGRYADDALAVRDLRAVLRALVGPSEMQQRADAMFANRKDGRVSALAEPKPCCETREPQVPISWKLSSMPCLKCGAVHDLYFDSTDYAAFRMKVREEPAPEKQPRRMKANPDAVEGNFRGLHHNVEHDYSNGCGRYPCGSVLACQCYSSRMGVDNPGRLRAGVHKDGDHSSIRKQRMENLCGRCRIHRSWRITGFWSSPFT